MVILSITCLSFLGYRKKGEVHNNNVIYSGDSVQVAATVKMTNQLTFVPDTVTIKSGQAVKWINTSLLAHTVTGDPSLSTIKNSAFLPQGAKPFNSGIVDPKQTYTHTFYKPGTYKYFCIPHEAEHMWAWVIVKAK